MKAAIVLSIALVLTCATRGFAADQTWTGAIGDSHCGANPHPGVFKGSKITGRECIVGRAEGPKVPGCIEAFGAQFIFVVDGKVFKISNQDFAPLRQFAAETVRLTGELSGDTITVKKIAPNK